MIEIAHKQLLGYLFTFRALLPGTVDPQPGCISGPTRRLVERAHFWAPMPEILIQQVRVCVCIYIYSILILFFFLGCTCGMWKFSDQGLKLCHSSDPGLFLIQILFPCRLLRDIEYSSLCYTVILCYLFYIQQCVYFNCKLLINFPPPLLFLLVNVSLFSMSVNLFLVCK